jgi:hypothetical protein
MNDLVPSIGSRTQTNSASARSEPNSSPIYPVMRVASRDQRSQVFFGAAVGGGDGGKVGLGFHRDITAAVQRQDHPAAGGSEFSHEGGVGREIHAGRLSVLAM